MCIRDRYNSIGKKKKKTLDKMKNNDDEVSMTDLTEVNAENTTINKQNSLTESTVMSLSLIHISTNKILNNKKVP